VDLELGAALFKLRVVLFDLDVVLLRLGYHFTYNFSVRYGLDNVDYIAFYI